MSKALIEFQGKPAGILMETDEGYEFLYDKDYLADAAAKPISLTLPLSGKAIRKYSANAQLDMVDFLELVYFSWLTGNNDMHLKNFSLYSPAGEPVLTPAYDLLNAVLSNPADDEELALNLNGKKKRMKDAELKSAYVELLHKRLMV